MNKGDLYDMSDHNYYLPVNGRLCTERTQDDPNFFRNCDIYVSISLHDESRAPMNNTALSLMTMAPYNYFSKCVTNLRNGNRNYRNLKSSVARQLVNIAEEIELATTWLDRGWTADRTNGFDYFRTIRSQDCQIQMNHNHRSPPQI